MDREIAQEVRNRRVAKRVVIAVVAVAALIFCVAATVSWLRPSVRRTDLQIARVERGSVDATLQATGTVVPEIETVIASPVEARALKIQHRAGDQLHAGDAILTLLAIAAARIESLNRFMTGFADVVRLPPPHPREVELAPVIDDIARLLRLELEHRRIALRVDVPPATRVRVDQSQFEQVIINVIRNAMESIGENGEVIVICREGVLSIADSGKGIDVSAREEIFTPFFTTKPEGRGLGLTVVSEILTNHHLQFSLANREGGGRSFECGFPCRAQLHWDESPPGWWGATSECDISGRSRRGRPFQVAII